MRPITTTTTVPAAVHHRRRVDQLDPSSTTDASPTKPAPAAHPSATSDDEDCRAGERLVGEFKFEDGRIFQAFALGGMVLVLAGSAASVVLVLLFNLMSDLTGGVRVTVLEEEPRRRRRSAGSGLGPPARATRFPRRD